MTLDRAASRVYEIGLGALADSALRHPGVWFLAGEVADASGFLHAVSSVGGER